VQGDNDIEQTSSRRRQPLNAGEKLCAGLLGMRIRWGADPYDCDYLPEKLKVEVKWRSRPNPVRSLGGVTHQFTWHDIDNRDFDFLLLVGEHQYVTYLWLVRTDDAHGILL
jgi:hypothetical protein